MELTTIRELFKNREAYLDKEVTVGGWIRSIRDSKTFGFIVLNDGSYFDTLQHTCHYRRNNKKRPDRSLSVTLFFHLIRYLK